MWPISENDTFGMRNVDAVQNLRASRLSPAPETHFVVVFPFSHRQHPCPPAIPGMMDAAIAHPSSTR